MRIGRNDNFLVIESIRFEPGYTVCRVESVANSSESRFSVTHDRVMIESSGQVLQQFEEFQYLDTQFFQLTMTWGGWIRCERNSKGCITISYRIFSRIASAAMEGEIDVDLEFSHSLYRGIRSLIADPIVR